jgi:oxygen-dependent protoporphyrinogen oxidase
MPGEERPVVPASRQTGPAAGERPIVAVVGGGIAGLAAAWELVGGGTAGPGNDRPSVMVLETDDRTGGKLLTEPFGDQMVDRGPDAFLSRRREATDLVAELGLDELLVPVGTTSASLWIDGRLRSMPAGLALGIPTLFGPLARSGVLSPGGLVRAGSDLLASRRPAPERTTGEPEDRAVGDIVAAALGREVVDRLADPLIGGINASSVRDMSAAAIFPALLQAASRPGSLMRNLRTTWSSGGSPAATQDRRAAEDPATMADTERSSPAGSAASATTSGPSSGKAPLFWSLRGGTGTLTGTLVDQLTKRGACVVTGARVRRLRRENGRWVLDIEGDRPPVALFPGAAGTALSLGPTETALSLGPTGTVSAPDPTGSVPPSSPGRWSVAVDGVVLAGPAGTTGDLLAPHAPAAAELLRGISYASVAVATFAFPTSSIGRTLTGSGVLVPRTSRLETAGRRHGNAPPLTTACTWLSVKWPHLEQLDQVLVRASAGRSGDERIAKLDDDVLVRRMIDEIRPVLGLSGVHTESTVTRWPRSFPQYAVGHLDRVAAIEEHAAALPALAVAGAAFHGVGIPACIGSGRMAGRIVLQALGRR